MRLASVREALLILLVLFLPTQLGLHFWPGWTVVRGIRVDYLSPTIYLTDIVVLLLILLEIYRTLCLKLHLRKPWQLSFWFILPLWLFLMILWAQEPFVHLYGLLRVMEIAFLAWVVSKGISRRAVKAWLISTIILALFCLWQFFSQTSLPASWAYWLGSRDITLFTPGAAVLTIKGALFLRPYATFSHPNSLAGYLLISGLLLLDCLSPRWRLPFTLLMLGAILAAWSQTAWVAAIIVLVLALVLKTKTGARPELTYLVLVLSILAPLLMLAAKFFMPGLSTREAWQIRSELFMAALNKPLALTYGLGLKNSLVVFGHELLTIKRAWLQPLHNFWWLWWWETGVVGMIWLLAVMMRRLRQVAATGSLWVWLAWIAFLITAATDHYWLTLIQNQLLLGLLFGLSLTKVKK